MSNKQGIQMKLKFIIALALLASLVGCGNSDSTGNQPLPTGFSYKVLADESNNAAQKNQLTIEISEKISTEQIATLANKLYSTKPKQRRFYIFYLLPNMKKGSGAWAISHFDPELKI